MKPRRVNLKLNLKAWANSVNLRVKLNLTHPDPHLENAKFKLVKFGFVVPHVFKFGRAKFRNLFPS
ncbi:hypothetical protein, partial [Campylobacter rectus]|uniref:hypothetical protein n=1 Tax=Campylobacter rectus TaxID=203 RepID=UPI0023F254C7